tara:strand:- start:256 stop:597 length:342 start_codon:yes stop_codon:yes gene_type:complete
MEREIANIHLRLLIASLRRKSEFWKKVAEKLSIPARQRSVVNLGTLEEYKDGDTVVIPGKLVAGGQLTKKLTISCWRFSEAVLSRLKQSGSSIIALDELASKDITGSKLHLVA